MKDSFKLVVKQFNLNIKNFFSNKINILLSSVFFISALFIPMIFIPLRYCYGVSLVVALVPLSSTIYYSSNLTFRSSTLYSNSSLGKNNRWIFNVSTIMVMIFFSFIVATIFYFLIYILNLLNLILINWWTYTDNGSTTVGDLRYNLNIWVYIVSIYCSLFLSLMVFSISFMVTRIYGSSKFYFSVILSIVILDIVFGGSLNQYFNFNQTDGTFEKYYHGLFPWSIFPLSFLFPFYSQGELINNAVWFSIERYNESSIWEPYFHDWGSIGLLTMKMFGGYHNLLWTSTLYFPYLEMIFFIAIGIFVSKLNKS